MAEAAQTQTDSNQQQQTREVNVVDVPVTNENVALNVMVALLFCIPCIIKKSSPKTVNIKAIIENDVMS